jgi:hypothetical protein
LTAAVALAAVLLCSSSAETGGAMMFRYPGVNCISESVAADGIFDGTNPLNPAEYDGTAVENAMSVSPGGVPINTPVEVFCPIPYIQTLEVQEFFPDAVNLRGSTEGEGLLYYEVQAYVDDNNSMAGHIECAVLATDAEVAGDVFDWEISNHLKTYISMGQTVLRWSMISPASSMSVFLTLHCTLPLVSAFGRKSQIIGYGLKKARLVP